MIQIKNLVWASAISTLIIAVIYDGNIDEQRGASRYRFGLSSDRASYSAGAGYGEHEIASRSAYYRDATEDLLTDGTLSRSAPD